MMPFGVRVKALDDQVSEKNRVVPVGLTEYNGGSLISINQASKSSGLRRGKIYQACRSGSIRSVKFGRMIYFKQKDFDWWFNRFNAKR